MSKVLVSACLLGRNCKYNGGNNYSEAVAAFLEGKEVIPVCPEVQAGLGVPRVPMELVDGVAVNRDGLRVHEALLAAVDGIVAQLEDVECAVLKSRSPTCGVKQIYDGSFSGTLIDGSGLLAQALMDAGCRVLDSEDV